jgi:hypothetical protein
MASSTSEPNSAIQMSEYFSNLSGLFGIISQTKEYNSKTIEVRYALCD